MEFVGFFINYLNSVWLEQYSLERQTCLLFFITIWRPQPHVYSFWLCNKQRKKKKFFCLVMQFLNKIILLLVCFLKIEYWMEFVTILKYFLFCFDSVEMLSHFYFILIHSIQYSIIKAYHRIPILNLGINCNSIFL